MKVVINTCYGGFGLSKEGMRHLIASGYKADSYLHIVADVLPPRGQRPSSTLALLEALEANNFSPDVERTDPRLVKIVERLGRGASGSNAQLKVVDVPDDVDWVLQEYDGAEWVAERHRIWR